MELAGLWQQLQSHETLLWWLAACSFTVFFGSLAALPFIAAQIPEDYFLRPKRRQRILNANLLVASLLIVAKNLAGLLLLAGGVLMLVLPGQGLLTIFAGLLLLDFPGKYAAERWLVSRRPVYRSINWLRRRRNRPPLRFPRT
jgi:hypothetical protein